VYTYTLCIYAQLVSLLYAQLAPRTLFIDMARARARVCGTSTVCVKEREGEKERQKEREQMKEREKLDERERERE